MKEGMNEKRISMNKRWKHNDWVKKENAINKWMR